MESQMKSEGPDKANEGFLLPEQENEESSFPEEIKSRGIKSINLLGTQLVITAELSGVFCQGVQYYDLKNILFINNAGMANLIDLLKSLLRQGVQVQFVNVNEKIKQKIKEMGLEHVLICS
jgi:ABC-type transporter Mla MlaB component